MDSARSLIASHLWCSGIKQPFISGSSFQPSPKYAKKIGQTAPDVSIFQRHFLANDQQPSHVSDPQGTDQITPGVDGSRISRYDLPGLVN